MLEAEPWLHSVEDLCQLIPSGLLQELGQIASQGLPEILLQN
jgi:hypothetical protein